jgi:hypothetical protein
VASVACVGGLDAPAGDHLVPFSDLILDSEAHVRKAAAKASVVVPQPVGAANPARRSRVVEPRDSNLGVLRVISGTIHAENGDFRFRALPP